MRRPDDRHWDEAEQPSVHRLLHGSRDAYIASEIIVYTYRGTRANHTWIVIRLDAKVYIVGAHALGMDSATSTVRNLPNPPEAESTASIKPPPPCLQESR